MSKSFLYWKSIDSESKFSNLTHQIPPACHFTINVYFKTLGWIFLFIWKKNWHIERKFNTNFFWVCCLCNLLTSMFIEEQYEYSITFLLMGSLAGDLRVHFCKFETVNFYKYILVYQPCHDPWTTSVCQQQNIFRSISRNGRITE